MPRGTMSLANLLFLSQLGFSPSNNELTAIPRYKLNRVNVYLYTQAFKRIAT